MRRIASIAGAAWALAAAPALAQTEVDLWHVFNIETDMIHDGIAAFNEAHDDIEIAPRVLPFAELRTELIRAVATGDVPDLVVIDSPETASFAAQGALEDLTERVEASEQIDPEEYYEGPWSSVVWDERVYGVPRAANTIALYYNADMFREAGLDPDDPPGTWAELRQAAETLTDEEQGVFGLAFSAIQSEEGTFQFLPWLYQAGGSLEDLASQEAVDALQYWVDLVEAGHATRDVVNMRQYEAANTFIAENAAMAISGPWELPRIDAEAGFDWRVTTLPVREGVDVEASALGDFNWTIPAGAENADAAFEFIEFMSTQKVLENAWNSGRLPPRKDIAISDPQWPAAFETFNRQMESARARGPHPEWPEISAAIQTAIQEALTRTKPPQEALTDAEAKVDPILAETPL